MINTFNMSSVSRDQNSDHKVNTFWEFIDFTWQNLYWISEKNVDYWSVEQFAYDYSMTSGTQPPND